MKKLLVSLGFVAIALVGCNDSSKGSQFVGSYANITNSDYCKNKTMSLVISKNDGGQKYSVKDIRNGNTIDDFSAELDGNTLIVDTGTTGKVNLVLENNQINWKNPNRAFSENCTMAKR